MTADQIPVLTDAEKLDLAEQIHEAVAQFKRLRDSIWAVETFTVRDVASELTTRQAKWLVAYIGLAMGQRSDTDTLNLPITPSTDLQASNKEIYTLQAAPKKFKADRRAIAEPFSTDLVVMELKFAKEKRPTTRRAA